MHCINNMERYPLAQDITDIYKLYEFKGKNFYYNQIFENDKEKINLRIINKDTFFFAKIFSTDLSEHRLKLLLEKNAAPNTKSEKFIRNLKQEFTEIRTRIFELLPNVIIDMANRIFKDVERITYNEEFSTPYMNFREEKTKKKQDELYALINKFKALKETKRYEMTFLITNFYVDFINMKLYKKRNEEIGLILLYVLLFSEKFEPFRYASFFENYYRNLESYNKKIIQAGFNWEEGFSQTQPLNIQIIKSLLECYNIIEVEMRDYLFDQEHSKSDFIVNLIMKGPEVFSKGELQEKHKYVSESTITKTLDKLKKEGKIQPLGTGRSAKWIRLIQPEVKFTINKNQQLSMDEFLDGKIRD